MFFFFIFVFFWTLFYVHATFCSDFSIVLLLLSLFRFIVPSFIPYICIHFMYSCHYLFLSHCFCPSYNPILKCLFSYPFRSITIHVVNMLSVNNLNTFIYLSFYYMFRVCLLYSNFEILFFQLFHTLLDIRFILEFKYRVLTFWKTFIYLLFYYLFHVCFFHSSFEIPFLSF